MRLRCEPLEPRAVPTLLGPAGGAPAGEAYAPDLSQTYRLHSLPGAPNAIYLDFDGDATAGTDWNAFYSGGAPIVTPAFAGPPATVQAIWRRVAEDYAPFAVDVTTEQPPAGTPSQHVVVGGNGAWFGAAGGVTYRGSFGTGTPDFVFSSALSNNAKYVAEAISHEAGHSLGLAHDGTASDAYYPGGGGWAPIMGAGYYQPLTQWSAGEYAGANNTQDDVAVIAARVGLRPDDCGDDFAHAAALVGGTRVAGLIGTRADVDAFRFDWPGGRAALKFEAAADGADLFARVSLYDAAGNLVASGAPASPSSPGFTLAADLPAGTYYAAVDGVGAPGAATATDYGSEGQYWLALVDPPRPGGASFLGAPTAGGTEGADAAQGADATPAYAAVVLGPHSDWVWAPHTTDPRAVAGLGACWHSATSFDIAVNVADGQSHAVTLYAVDWDSRGRSQRVEVLDAATGAVLDSRTVSDFTAGARLSWSVSGSVVFRVTRLAGVNAVLGGIFFD